MAVVHEVRKTSAGEPIILGNDILTLSVLRRVLGTVDEIPFEKGS